MKKYAYPDFLNELDLLSPEERLVQESTRDFVTNEVLPVLQKSHRDEQFPKHLIRRFGEMGFFGANLKGYGLPGLNDVAYGLMLQELEAGDSGIRSCCSVQGSLVMYAIWAFGSEAQKEHWLPRLASGEAIGCFGLTESDAGSDPGAMKTRAEKVAGGYRLNGTKVWITNGSISDVAVVWAKLDGRVHGFLVESGTPGFEATTIQGKFSLRVSITSELHLTECVVPEANMLPLANVGLRAPLSCLSQARFGIVFGVIGSAAACFQVAREYASSRIIFGEPLASYQLAQAKLVWQLQEITKAQLLAIQLGRLKERGQLQPEQISLGKLNNCKMALDVARSARDILGASGIVDEYPIMRHLMNLETVNTYEGTEDVHRLVVGQAITGIPAFR